jgi:hypothetical protein
MPTTSARLGLAKPLDADPFDTPTLADNWQLVDDSPGIFICTSGTRPGSWGANHEGMLIWEKDTDLTWRWNGSAFVRHSAKGHLVNERTTADVTEAAGVYETVVQAAVPGGIPDGDLNIACHFSWFEVTGGKAQFALFRGATQLASWKCLTEQGGSFHYVDVDPASGAATYSVKVKNLEATTTVECAIDSPATLDLYEVGS